MIGRRWTSRAGIDEGRTSATDNRPGHMGFLSIISGQDRHIAPFHHSFAKTNIASVVIAILFSKAKFLSVFTCKATNGVGGQSHHLFFSSFCFKSAYLGHGFYPKQGVQCGGRYVRNASGQKVGFAQRYIEDALFKAWRRKGNCFPALELGDGETNQDRVGYELSKQAVRRRECFAALWYEGLLTTRSSLQFFIFFWQGSILCILYPGGTRIGFYSGSRGSVRVRGSLARGSTIL